MIFLHLQRIIRSHLKKEILVQGQGGTKLQPAGILKYVEDLKRGPNAEIGPKDFFEIASKKDSESLQVSRSEWLAVVPDVASRAAKQGIRVTYPKVYLDLDETFECAGLVADNYFIFPNGRVYRCPLCEDFPLHSLLVEKNRLVVANSINEMDLFQLRIPEGCVMNRIVQPDNIIYTDQGNPEYKIACCMLKEEVQP